MRFVSVLFNNVTYYYLDVHIYIFKLIHRYTKAVKTRNVNNISLHVFLYY
jgi:hypothetical protein